MWATTFWFITKWCDIIYYLYYYIIYLNIKKSKKLSKYHWNTEKKICLENYYHLLDYQDEVLRGKINNNTRCSRTFEFKLYRHYNIIFVYNHEAEFIWRLQCILFTIQIYNLICIDVYQFDLTSTANNNCASGPNFVVDV